MATLRESSRKEYTTHNLTGVPTENEIKCGALQRIADATEKMAQRYTELISQRDYFEREAKRLRSECERLARSNAALRGHLKRAKSKSVEVKP